MHMLDDSLRIDEIKHATSRCFAIGHDAIFATDIATGIGNENLLQTVFCSKAMVTIDAIA